jgi:hypothetical protein
MAQPEPLTPYVPPQPAFRRCRCGALVLRTKQGDIVTPLLGLPHRCAFIKEAA